MIAGTLRQLRAGLIARLLSTLTTEELGRLVGAMIARLPPPERLRVVCADPELVQRLLSAAAHRSQPQRFG